MQLQPFDSSFAAISFLTFHCSLPKPTNLKPNWETTGNPEEIAKITRGTARLASRQAKKGELPAGKKTSSPKFIYDCWNILQKEIVEYFDYKYMFVIKTFFNIK